MATPFNQGAPTVPVVMNTSNVFVFGNTASGNALSVQQLGTGNVASFRTTTGATALFVGANGNVGVGTTNPATALDVFTGTMNAATVVATTHYGAIAGSNTVSASTFTGSGSGITSLNMDNAGSGTLAVARGGTGVTASTGTGSVVLSASPTLSGTITGGTFSGTHTGDGSGVTSLNMGNAGSGTLAVARGGTGVTSSTGTGSVVLSASPALSGTATFASITTSGNVGIGTASPGLSLSVNGSVNLGAAYYTGSYNTKTGPFILQASGFDAVGTTHTIAYSSWQGSVNGDNLGGIMIIIGKNLSGSGKVGCMTLSISKRAGAYTFTQTINNNTVGLSTFSVSTSNNDIIITSDSDMAITWTFIAGV